ncbi:hypothetical protein NUK49_21990, partial [Aeromonas caviae]|nr:hypothetical protein [Aeromonas caviae]
SKQESGIKRRSSHFSCVNTVPVNTYPIEAAGETEEAAPNEETQAANPSHAPQARRQYTRRKYDRYFSPKRILLFALLLVSLTSLAIVIYGKCEQVSHEQKMKILVI